MIVQIHQTLARSGVMFFLALGVWALFLRIRSRPLDSSWYGAVVIGELLAVAQFALGVILYAQGAGDNLPRPLIHILYGIVAVITLPSAYGYASRYEDENIKTLLMGIVCLFQMEMFIRAATVAIA
jgi:hypothetical protein